MVSVQFLIDKVSQMIFMTELEERLYGPEGEHLRDTLVHRLSDMESRLRRPALLPRADFLKASSLADAALAAREVLATWPTDTSKRPVIFLNLSGEDHGSSCQ